MKRRATLYTTITDEVDLCWFLHDKDRTLRMMHTVIAHAPQQSPAPVRNIISVESKLRRKDHVEFAKKMWARRYSEQKPTNGPLDI